MNSTTNIGFAITVVLVLAGLYAFKYVTPFEDFKRMGEVQFPKGSRILETDSSPWSLSGKIAIPKTEREIFIKDNQLKEYANDLYTKEQCLHDGRNRVLIEFDAHSSTATITVHGPDHSGGKVCDFDSVSTES